MHQIEWNRRERIELTMCTICTHTRVSHIGAAVWRSCNLINCTCATITIHFQKCNDIHFEWLSVQSPNYAFALVFAVCCLRICTWVVFKSVAYHTMNNEARRLDIRQTQRTICIHIWSEWKRTTDRSRAFCDVTVSHEKIEIENGFSVRN